MQALFDGDNAPITAEAAAAAIVSDMRAYLQNMEAYLSRRCAAYAEPPLRFASYWHPTKGQQYLAEDWHRLGRCGALEEECEVCAAATAAGEGRMGAGDYLASAWWRLGFWDHADHREEIQAAVERGPIFVAGGGEDDVALDLPRGGVSLGPRLDEFYDTYLFQAVESMFTERGLGDLKRKREVAGGGTTEEHTSFHGPEVGNSFTAPGALTDTNRRAAAAAVRRQVAARAVTRAVTGSDDLDGHIEHIRERVLAAQQREQLREEAVAERARQHALAEQARARRKVEGEERRRLQEMAKEAKSKKAQERAERARTKKIEKAKRAFLVGVDYDELIFRLAAHEELDVDKLPKIREARARMLRYVTDELTWLEPPPARTTAADVEEAGGEDEDGDDDDAFVAQLAAHLHSNAGGEASEEGEVARPGTEPGTVADGGGESSDDDELAGKGADEVGGSAPADDILLQRSTNRRGRARLDYARLGGVMGRQRAPAPPVVAASAAEATPGRRCRPCCGTATRPRPRRCRPRRGGCPGELTQRTSTICARVLQVQICTKGMRAVPI